MREPIRVGALPRFVVGTDSVAVDCLAAVTKETTGISAKMHLAAALVIAA